MLYPLRSPPSAGILLGGFASRHVLLCFFNQKKNASESHCVFVEACGDNVRKQDTCVLV